MPSPRIIALAGSLRKDSFNKKLARIAADEARAAGAEVTYIDLADYPMPIYDGDIEAASGIPEPARTLNQLFREHHGLLIASPEYNSSISGVLKNAIDWISRPQPGPPPLPNVAAFSGKVAAIMTTSPGALGGLRGLVHLRSILGNIDVTVIPNQLAIPKAAEEFDAGGKLKDPKKLDQVRKIAQKLVEVAGKLAG